MRTRYANRIILSASAPEAGSTDLARWRSLCVAADAIVADAGADEDELARAAAAAAKATLPRSQRSQSSPLYLLLRTAQAYARLNPAQREDARSRMRRFLGELEGKAVVTFSAPPTDRVQVVREPRRDVFG